MKTPITKKTWKIPSVELLDIKKITSSGKNKNDIEANKPNAAPAPS
jgi:hypothetical protein